MLHYTDKMSFIERWYNTIARMCDYIARHAIHLPSERKLANKYFASFAPLPTLDDLIRNVSLVLINSHRAIAPPRPSMPSIPYSLIFSSKNEYITSQILSSGIIPIGGAHIKPAKSLPEDLKTFLDGAKDGAIYFSLGTILDPSRFPSHLIQTFLGKIYYPK